MATVCILTLMIMTTGQASAGVLISPARLEVTVGPDGQTPGLVAANRSDTAVNLHFSLAGGGHDLEGMPVFDERAQTAAALAQVVHISPAECLLAPGESIAIDINAHPIQEGIYPVVIADIVPVRNPANGIVAATRIAVPLLITKSDARQAQSPVVAAINVLAAQEQAGGPVVFETILHNAGATHTRAGGRLLVQGPQTTAEISLPAVTVLPGFARRLRTSWSPTALPPGDYVVRFLPDNASPGYTPVATGQFQVVKPYELASVKLKLEELRVVHDLPGFISVQALLANNGNVSAIADVEMSLMQATDVPATTSASTAAVDMIDASPAGTLVVTGNPLATKSVTTVIDPSSGRLLHSAIDIAGIQPGTYIVQATVWHQSNKQAVIEQPLQITAAHLAAR